MGNSIFTQAAQFLRDRRDNRRWQAAVCCLATVVICGTAWALIRQGQALNDSKGDVLDCKFEVHKHSTDCYEDERLVCGKVEYVVHTHEDTCYDEDGGLLCLLPEEEGHVHGAECFKIEESIVCELEESAVDSYMVESSGEQEDSFVGYALGSELICGQEEHSHTDDCYTVTEESTLICGQEEQGGHSHTDACYGEEGTLICGQEEYTGHTHDDSCYTITAGSTLTCGWEEHTHNDGCYDSTVQDTDSAQNGPAAGHTHSGDCYQLVRRLVCGKEGVHIHDADCYQDGTLICTAPEVDSLEEHIHGPECFGESEDEEYTQIFMNGDIKVTAVYRTSAKIPEDAVMDVEQITDQDNEHYENRLAELERMDGVLADDEEMVMLLGFDFHTLDEKFMPKDTVNLTVQFLNDSIYAEGDEVTVACFDNGGVNLISGTDIDEKGLTTFDVDNLSELAFITSAESARELVYEGEDYIVTVTLGEDSAVPADAELIAEKITQEDSESYVEYFEKLDEAGVLEDNETAAMLLDMKIYAEDREIVPDGTMEVRVQFLNREIYFEGDAVKAAHITADDIVLLEASDIDDDISTTFTVDELAEVAFITDGDIRTLTAEGEDYIVTVRFSPKAMIPEDAELVAKRITRENDPEHFTAREEQVQAEHTDEFIAVSALFDICFYDAEGVEIEPQSVVDVKIQLFDKSNTEKSDANNSDAEKSDSVKVAHFTEDKESEEKNIEIIENVDVTRDENGNLSTTFQTESFSEYAFYGEGDVTDEASFRRAMEWAQGKEAGKTRVVKLGDSFKVTGSKTIEVTQGIQLDLNGNTIKVDNGNYYFINVSGSGSLDIIDSSTKDHPGPTSTEKGGEHGKTTYKYSKDNSAKLETITFTVTESKVIDSLNGRTQDDLYTYTVTGHGAIVGSTGNKWSLFTGSGNLSFNDGVVIAGNNNRAIYSNGSGTKVITLNDCYVVDHKAAQNAGAIYCEGGTINIHKGAIISGNEAALRGGAILINNGGTVNMDGGYVTNNTSQQSTISGKDIGAGGGLLIFEATLNMSGGYVTGNIAHIGGGGIALDNAGYNNSPTVATITGGYISSNSCVGTRGEGGGIGAYGYFTYSTVRLTIQGSKDSKVYITNNKVSNTQDWGGGGLFVASHVKAYLKDTLITENTADGFGGGLGGCSTGRIFNSETNGAAIFDNTADGKNRSTLSGGKNADSIYANKYMETLFLKGKDGRNLYEDCFSALYTELYKTMLGGGLEEWDGIIDGNRITGNESRLKSSFLQALTAYPSDDAKALARADANVYFNGNYTNVHGGGIMCNGVTAFGDKPDEMEYPSSLEITAKKVLKDGSKTVKMDAGQFTFTIYEDEACTKPVTKGTNDVDGKISFEEYLRFDLEEDNGSKVVVGKEYQYQFYIKEDAVTEDSDNLSIVTSDTIYRLDVTVVKTEKHQDYGEDHEFPRYKDLITKIQLYKKTPTTKWTSANSDCKVTGKLESSLEKVELELTNGGALFTNEKKKPEDIYIKKNWDGFENEAEKKAAMDKVEYIEVELCRDVNGKLTPVGNSRKQLNAENGWMVKWEGMDPNASQSYVVKEVSVKFKGSNKLIPADYQYTSSYNYKFEYIKVGNETRGTGTVTITNAPKKFGIELVKKGDDGSKLRGAEFQILKSGSDDPIEFVYDAEGYESGVYTVWDGETNTVKYNTLKTNNEGLLRISGLSEGQYIIREYEAPIGYKAVSDHMVTFTLGGAGKEPSGTIECLGEGKCTELEGDISFDKGDNSDAILKLIMTDPEDIYELPETGGIVNIYIGIMAAVLFVGIVAVMYITYRRRKGELRG